MSNGHDWGVLVQAPLNGQWCRKCGYSQASDQALQDCPSSSPTGRILEVNTDWINDPVQIVVLQSRAIDALIAVQTDVAV